MTKSKKHKKTSLHKQSIEPIKGVASQSASDNMWIDNTHKQLREETDFSKYLELLIPYSKTHMVIVAVDAFAHLSAIFTSEVANNIMRLGFHTCLTDKDINRWSYAGIMNEDKLIYEGLSQTQPVKHDVNINGLNVSVTSVGRDARGVMSDTKIIINGRDYLSDIPPSYGIAFVVYDISQNIAIDSVLFWLQTYSCNCMRASDSKKKISVQSRYPGVTFISTPYIKFPTRKYTENEKFIKDYHITFHTILELPDQLFGLLSLSDAIKPQDVTALLTPPDAYRKTDGTRCMVDRKGEYFNIIGGKRLTINQPQNYKRTVFVLGGCDMLGIGARDSGTFASQLQDILNKTVPERGFIVQNYGQALAGLDLEKELTLILDNIPLVPGDIVIGYGGIKAVPLKNNKNPYVYGDVFFDIEHYNENGYRYLARVVFDTLEQNAFFEETILMEQGSKAILDAPIPAAEYEFNPAQQAMLEDYKSGLVKFYTETLKEYEPLKIGAIVMNCNPFTLGHRYLIDTCIKQVDFLLVFVVQEDKSFLPFEDRLDLVCKGVKDIPNVGIVKSGQFIISTLTFKEYFNKAEKQEMQVDTSMDITLFAREIAPCVNISVRFVGEEPFDKVTKQYNETMKVILPRYEINVVEIPRMKLDDEAISASRVRKLLESKRFNEIARLVPQTTLDYLLKRFG